MPICKLCGKKTDSLYHITEQLVLDMIRRDHPEWVQEDGVCAQCIEYYKNLDNAVEIIE